MADNDKFLDAARYGPRRAKVMQSGQSRGSVVATIANGASLSGAIDLGLSTLAGVIMPAAWTAADISLDVSIDGETYVPLFDGATERKVVASAAAVASRFLALNPVDYRSIRFIKVRSGLVGAAVPQAAARLVTLVLV